jgi:hypothetical protein
VSDGGRQVRLRRGPRVGVFLITGLVIGALVGLAIALATPPSPQYPTSQVAGFLVLLFAPVGVVLAGLVAVVLDASSRRRARIVEAEHESGSGDPE